MRIYVAGSTRNVAEVKRIADALEDEGHTITFKWWSGEGEIRQDDIRSEDLELIPGPYTDLATKDDWAVRVKHKPSGLVATATGNSKDAAHDLAIAFLREQLNLGWRGNTEGAKKIAQTEVDAVNAADCVVLVYSDKILGAALECGGGIWGDKLTYVFRPTRDSVFWYLDHVHVVYSLPDMLDQIRAEQEDDIELLRDSL